MSVSVQTGQDIIAVNHVSAEFASKDTIADTTVCLSSPSVRHHFKADAGKLRVIWLEALV